MDQFYVVDNIYIYGILLLWIFVFIRLIDLSHNLLQIIDAKPDLVSHTGEHLA